MKSLAIALLVCLAACSGAQPEEHTRAVTSFNIELSSAEHFTKTAPNCYKRAIEWTATGSALGFEPQYLLQPTQREAELAAAAEARAYADSRRNPGYGASPAAAVADYVRKHSEVFR